MPTETFHNLPADKRERFVAAALDEFVAHPYDQASISRMVAQLGIAKGSVYQYFDGKADLFRWLVEEAGRRKVARLGLPELQGMDPFEELRTLYVLGMRWWRDEPRWARVALRSIEPTGDPEIAAMREVHVEAGIAFLGDWVRRAQQAGALRTEADPEILGTLLYGLLSDGLIKAVLRAAGVTLADLPTQSLPIDDATLEAIVDEAMWLISDGV